MRTATKAECRAATVAMAVALKRASMFLPNENDVLARIEAELGLFGHKEDPGAPSVCQRWIPIRQDLAWALLCFTQAEGARTMAKRQEWVDAAVSRLRQARKTLCRKPSRRQRERPPT